MDVQLFSVFLLLFCFQINFMKISWTLWAFLQIFACTVFLKVYFMEHWLDSLLVGIPQRKKFYC